MGDMPAGLTRLVRRCLRPMLDWLEQLSRFFEQCSDSDYSWTTPDRRYVHQGLYLPSRREAKLPEIVLAIDCSGSVDEALLTRFCAELSGLLETYDATLHVLYHDIKVNGTKTLTRQDMLFSLEEHEKALPLPPLRVLFSIPQPDCLAGILLARPA